MVNIQFCLLSFVVCVSFTNVSGRIKPGGNWNRPFRQRKLTVEEYVEDLSWRVGNVTASQGLGIKLTDYSFKVDNTLLGLTLKGDITFQNGVITNKGAVVPSHTVITGNRTDDNKIGVLEFFISVTTLGTIYDLKTNLEENNAEGTIETTMDNVDFYFRLEHKFDSNENTVTALEFLYSESEFPSWTIKPRNLQTYAIETLARRDSDANTWFSKDLVTWQSTVLGPIIQEQSNGMEFPINPI